MTEPEPIDTTVWRELGNPLVSGAPDGPLTGSTVAVKDLYDVAGHPVGAGNPTWLASAEPAAAHAPVVAALLAAGASVRGITRTDELAYSLYGVNDHYGTPPNPAAPGRAPGGSSSGSAAAVALGAATIGLGTDTGGSIRVPAAYQGLYGIRTTHGLVSRDGLVPLAPTFDAVGWLTRDAKELARVGEVLLPPSPGGSRELIAFPELFDVADPEVAEVVSASVTYRSLSPGRLPLDAWREAFIVLQAWEAWQAHGGWLEGRMDALGADVRGRFERGRQVTRRGGGRGPRNGRRRAPYDPRPGGRPRARAAVRADRRPTARRRPRGADADRPRVDARAHLPRRDRWPARRRAPPGDGRMAALWGLPGRRAGPRSRPARSRDRARRSVNRA